LQNPHSTKKMGVPEGGAAWYDVNTRIKESGMKRMSAAWRVAVVGLTLTACAGEVRAQALPSAEPIPRIETGMHGAMINRIGVDATCRLMVTGSDDKTARLWALPEDGAAEPKLLRVLRVPARR
jgi:hypothetical protein